MISKFDKSERENFFTNYDMKLLEDKQHRYLHYAPYYILENAFNPSEVSKLNDVLYKYDYTTKKGSIIGSTSEQAIENNYRNSEIYFVESNADPEFEVFNDKIIEITERVNSQVFNLDLKSCMNPQYTIYAKDMHFDWHPDGPLGVLDARGLNCIPDHLHWRKLTAVTALTPETFYEGGDFQIMSPSASPKDCIHTIRLDAGSMIFFPAFTAHRVTPVQAGTRKTLVHWFCGPRWR